MPKRKCTGTTKKGTPCSNWGKPETDPPRCWRHPVETEAPEDEPPKAKAGAPKGNKNAEKHGAYSQPTDPIANAQDAIGDLQRKRERLSQHIDRSRDDVTALEHAKLLDLLGRLDSRIARLIKHLAELSGEPADRQQADVDAALVVAARVLGINPTDARQ